MVDPSKTDGSCGSGSSWSRFKRAHKKTPSNTRAVLAEFVATTLFVYVGCGTAVASQSLSILHPGSQLSGTFLVAVALAFGTGIAVLAFATAPISGGHINPAVTAAFIMLRYDRHPGLRPLLGLLYVLAQCLGGVLGAALVFGTYDVSAVKTLNGTMPAAPPFSLGVNAVAPGVPVGSAFLGEMMGTLLLVFTVLMTAAYKHNIASNLAPIAIGWSVLLAHLVLVPLTGCGINPARSLGPMVVDLIAGSKVGHLGWWVFYVAPFVGAALAALLCRALFGVGTDGEGVFGEDAAAEADMKELRAAEPLTTANILTAMDVTETDEEAGDAHELKKRETM